MKHKQIVKLIKIGMEWDKLLQASIQRPIKSSIAYQSISMHPISNSNKTITRQIKDFVTNL